ncbi:hypothetical protein [Curtobacterium sp. MCBD17_008]|uniref:hypothetical protein n=1 Tax=Curtobacterium sp. MCBD17_008 TaxID=2175656 RepID=UPI000DA7E66A|nr:hypothetical protein [Curtobacterium sp. MCBD17_008]PZE92899.1 hypothetical protein DEI95_08040 [Curtobacterium sp. MCBD17_008]
MYDSADAAADLRHAAAAWSGSFDGRTTFTLPASAAPNTVHRWSATFGIDYDDQQRTLTAVAASGHLVHAPTSQRNLLATITDDGDAASFAATVHELDSDGPDRTMLLFAGIDGGDILHLDDLTATVIGDITATAALRTILNDLAAGTPTLLLTRPNRWGIGSTDVAIAAAAEAGLEQWGDTDVWTYFGGEDE